MTYNGLVFYTYRMNSKDIKKQNASIQQLGAGTLMAMFGITTRAVFQWRMNGIPKPCLMYLKLNRLDLFAKSKKFTSSKNTHKEKL